MESDTERIHEQNYIDPSLTGVVRNTASTQSEEGHSHGKTCVCEVSDNY